MEKDGEWRKGEEESGWVGECGKVGLGGRKFELGGEGMGWGAVGRMGWDMCDEMGWGEDMR